jgi:hypothetical protein
MTMAIIVVIGLTATLIAIIICNGQSRIPVQY